MVEIIPIARNEKIEKSAWISREITLEKFVSIVKPGKWVDFADWKNGIGWEDQKMEKNVYWEKFL